MARAIGPVLSLGLLLLGSSADSAPLPALSTVSARHERAVVRVLSPEGRVLSSGFFVATVGYAVAALPGAKVGDALVVELDSGARRRAAVARADPRSALVVLAVAAADDDEVFPTLTLDDGEGIKGAPAGWLVALCHDDEGRVSPAAGMVRELAADGSWLLDLPCGAGAPVLAGDEVVGVIVRARGVTASTGTGLERVRALSEGLPRKLPRELPAAAALEEPSLAPPSAGPRARP